MASTGNNTTRTSPFLSAKGPVSEVSSVEKQALYSVINHRRPRKFIRYRSVVFLLIAAAFGLAAAVLAIRLFPM